MECVSFLWQRLLFIYGLFIFEGLAWQPSPIILITLSWYLSFELDTNLLLADLNSKEGHSLQGIWWSGRVSPGSLACCICIYRRSRICIWDLGRGRCALIGLVRLFRWMRLLLGGRARSHCRTSLSMLIGKLQQFLNEIRLFRNSYKQINCALRTATVVPSTAISTAKKREKQNVQQKCVQSMWAMHGPQWFALCFSAEAKELCSK